MAKIKLGNRPKNFKHTVTVDMLDGTKGSIECIFKYRTRKEFGALIDSMNQAARDEAKKREATEADTANSAFSVKEFHEKTIDANADYIVNILDGWNLDIDLDRDAVQQLADEYPGAAAAIVEAYRSAITEGRLGN